MQCSRALVAVHGAELEHAQRQLAVRTLALAEDQAVHRAVHGLGVVDAVVHLHRRVHALGVEVEVPGGLEQPGVGQVRRIHELIAAGLVAVAAVVLHDLAHHRALGMPHGQPAAQLSGEAQQVELGHEPPVVSLGGLLQPLQVRRQLGLGAPRGAVDALQHLAVLVAAPVGARHPHQLEMAQPPGVGNVGATAQVDEFVGIAVGGDHPAGRARGRVVGLTVEDLDLVGVRGKQLVGGGPVYLGPDEWLTGSHDGAHLGLDRCQIVVGERARPPGVVGAEVEVVIEAVGDRRPDREGGAGIQPQHRLGQHVGGRVAQHLEPFVG